MKKTAAMHSTNWVVLGLALAFCALALPVTGLADDPVFRTYSSIEVYETYRQYAWAKGHLKVIQDDMTSPPVTTEEWEEGWAESDDQDGDGLTNKEEFDGFEATVNGQTGWFSYAYKPGRVYLGPGSDPERFDGDGDGISDFYESEYTKTNPSGVDGNGKDTDGDGIPDAVEAYAGLDPCQNGWIYTVETGDVTFEYDLVARRLIDDSEIVSDHKSLTVKVVVSATPQAEEAWDEEAGAVVETGVNKMTPWHRDFDIDGDGLSNYDEVEPNSSGAISAMNNNYSPPERKTPGKDHFPFEILDNASWTSPVNCDSDGDWLLDSFETSFLGLDPKNKEEQGSGRHWSEDADRDGLVNIREQCLHPLLANGWPGVKYIDNALAPVTQVCPFGTRSFHLTYSGKLEKAEAASFAHIGTRYPGTKILEGVPGYLHDAQYSKAGDSARFYNEKGELQAAQGNVFWGYPSSYWTTPVTPWPGSADSDGDDLPDGWEVEHGLNPLSADGPSGLLGDPDQDGLANYEEYWGQDGHRIDRVKGTGDETSPWITRGLNYAGNSQFEDYLTHEDGVDWFISRERYQSPCSFSLANIPIEYSATNYPGLFQGYPRLKYDVLSMTWSEVEQTHYAMGTYETIDGEGNPSTVTGLVKTTVANLVPFPGVPPQVTLNDNEQLAAIGGYGPEFEAISGLGAFQPFATAYGNFFYYEDPEKKDGRYTPGVDAVWYHEVKTEPKSPYYDADGVYVGLTDNGDLVLADPSGLLTGGEQGYPLYDNIPLMMPMSGRDTDNDGLPDSMEIQMDPARDKNFSSPVAGLSPLVARSAHIVNTNGMQAAFTTDLFIFSRQFTIEAWVYLSGDAPAEGTFVRGGLLGSDKWAYDLGVKPLRVGGTPVAPEMLDTVPYFGFHTVGGKWYQVSATQPLPRGKWVHLAGSFDPDKNGLSLYIDGVLVQTRSVQEESYSAYIQYYHFGMGALLTVGQGADFADRLWIDEVRIWGVERTASEINANFNHLIEGYQQVTLDKQDLIGGLMAYYPFDDGGNAAADQRHRARSSLHKNDYPAQGWVVNSLKHEYYYPDLSYAFPVEKLGGAFVFDSGNVAPVSGVLDSQQGELDSDGDGLPDSFELQNNMNPFSWFTPTHRYARYDAQWGNVADASVIIHRDSLLDWAASSDGGVTWTTTTCPLITSTAGGVVTQTCCPNTILIGSFNYETNKVSSTNDTSSSTSTSSDGTNNSQTSSGDVAETNYEVTVTTNWVVMSGAVRDTIAIGETWWTTTDGTLVAQVNQNGKMVSDADGDYDGDGLTNLQEYWARTNPYKKDTNEDGIPDGEEDFDQDGLPNGMEADNGARQDLADTDDDGFDDLLEVSAGTSPSDSGSPAQSLATYFDGKPGTWLEVRDTTKYVLDSWTVEAKVLPAGIDFLGDGQSACILRRGVETTTNGMTVANYELRVVRDGESLYPLARYVFKNNRGAGEVVELRGTNALPTAAVGDLYNASNATHLVVTYYGPAKRLSLYMDGDCIAATNQLTSANANSGEGPSAILRMGEGFRGFIDDVCVWSEERRAESIKSSAGMAPLITEPALVAKFSFDDGGWTNNFASGRYTNILFSVKSLTPIAVADMRDGDTWVDGDYVMACDAGKVFTNGTVAELGPVFCEGTLANSVSATKGQFGWSYLDQVLYCYDGTRWVKWGKTPLWLADVRSLVKGKVTGLDQIVKKFDPTPGDQFIDTDKGVVYIYRATLPMDRPNGTGDSSLAPQDDPSYVAELEADPLRPGHRFYLQSQETIVEWTGTELVTIAQAYEADGRVVMVQSEGMAYKSDAGRMYFRKWGYVPTLEDSTVDRDWENGWTSAARFSGGVQLCTASDSGSSSGYTPVIGGDSDGDGLPDKWEQSYGLDPNDPGFGTNGIYRDLDGDGVPEYLYDPYDFINGPWGDPDGDGLNNRAEYLAGTNPMKFDTYNNGESDFEASRPPSIENFGARYMDGDDIPDAWESLFPKACSPLRFDTYLDPDGDGWDNYSEYMAVRKTHSTNNYYEVSTNADGTVSSNFVSGDGYYIPYCLPDDSSVYPQPEMNFHFKVDCPKIPPMGEKWYLRIFAYTDPAMACPDAETAILMSTALRNGNTLSITDWSEGGHLRQGANYFMAYIDENNDHQWNDGELLGFSENMPENISWGSADVYLNLSEQGRGFPRVSWAGATMTEGSETSSNAETTVFSGLELSTFVFLEGNTMKFRKDLTGCQSTRQFLHEYDFMNEMGATPLKGIYNWSITGKGAEDPYAAGTVDLRNYATSLKEPVVNNPKGKMQYAKTRLNMTLDRDITNLRVVVQDTVSGETILDESMLAPYVDQENQAEIDFPQLFGWGKLTNGTYTLTVTESNPMASATSKPVTFKVDLISPVEGGGASIGGTIIGLKPSISDGAPFTNVIVEAYSCSGFDQKPMAKVHANADGTYELRGLSVGPAYIRAFHDADGNGEFDESEAWTILKGAPDSIRSITWVTAQIRGKTPRGGVSTEAAVSGYATDYSLKNVNIKTLRAYTGNDMVLHNAGDTDMDGLLDSWELYYAGDLTTMNQATDLDGDGLSDLDEFSAGSDPTLSDTDGDGLSDAEEVVAGTNPALADTDEDGLSDFEEIKMYNTNPNNPDSDGDGITDFDEVKGTFGSVTDPLNDDTDGDGMKDGVEIANGYDPTDPTDGEADDDSDGLTNAQELTIGTDPKNADSDGDGWIDGEDPAPRDPTDPGVPPSPSSKVAFKKAPAINGSGEMEMELAVAEAPLEITVQSASVLSGAPEWADEYGPTVVTETTDSLVVTVPAAPGSAVKMFRVIYNKP